MPESDDPLTASFDVSRHTADGRSKLENIEYLARRRHFCHSLFSPEIPSLCHAKKYAFCAHAAVAFSGLAYVSIVRVDKMIRKLFCILAMRTPLLVRYADSAVFADELTAKAYISPFKKFTLQK